MDVRRNDLPDIDRMGIYIDETGSPGLASQGKYSFADSKTWVAVILNKYQRAEALVQMQDCLEEIQKICGATEFHFTDIFMGRGEFSKVSFEQRMQLFSVFAEVFKNENYPILIQSFSADDFTRSKIIIDKKPIFADNLKLNNYGDFALLLLFHRIKRFLKEKHIPPVDIIIDEGRMKKDIELKSRFMKGFVHNNVLHFKSSHEAILLQLADFAAYCLNRCRHIQINNLKSDEDIDFLRLCEYADFNVLNIKKKVISVDDNFSETYDRILDEAYLANNHITSVELDDYKKDLEDYMKEFTDQKK